MPRSRKNNKERLAVNYTYNSYADYELDFDKKCTLCKFHSYNKQNNVFCKILNETVHYSGRCDKFNACNKREFWETLKNIKKIDSFDKRQDLINFYKTYLVENEKDRP